MLPELLRRTTASNDACTARPLRDSCSGCFVGNLSLPGRPPLPSAVLAPCARRRGVMLRRERFHVRCFVISPCAMPHHALCARITRFARVFNRLRVWRRCSPHVCVAPRCPHMPLLRSAARRRVSLVSASKASLTGRPLSPMSAPVVCGGLWCCSVRCRAARGLWSHREPCHIARIVRVVPRSCCL